MILGGVALRGANVFKCNYLENRDITRSTASVTRHVIYFLQDLSNGTLLIVNIGIVFEILKSWYLKSGVTSVISIVHSFHCVYMQHRRYSKDTTGYKSNA